MKRDPYRGRMMHCTREWQAIKEAIDLYREGNEEDDEVREVLIDYKLWDFSRACMDEDAVNHLYKEYT